jgi:hypothetical protein
MAYMLIPTIDMMPVSYKDYRDKREKEHQAWVQRKKEREEKMAKGEPVGPEESDPTEEREIGCIGLLKFFTIALLVTVLAGKFFTGDYLWDYQGKWRHLKAYLPVRHCYVGCCGPPSNHASRAATY